MAADYQSFTIGDLQLAPRGEAGSVAFNIAELAARQIEQRTGVTPAIGSEGKQPFQLVLGTLADPDLAALAEQRGPRAGWFPPADRAG